MQTQAQDKLLQNIDGITEWIKQTADAVGKFAQTETPLFIQEYLAWVLWDNVLATAFGVFLLLTCASTATLAVRFFKKDADKMGGYFGASVSCVVMCIMSGLIGVVIVCNSVPAIVKVKVAPRLVLLEKTTEIINKIK